MPGSGRGRGRPRLLTPEIETWIIERRRAGLSLRGILSELSQAGVRAPRGGRWQLSTIQRVLKRHQEELPRSRPGRRDCGVVNGAFVDSRASGQHLIAALVDKSAPTKNA
jgi:hypothetical protein